MAGQADIDRLVIGLRIDMKADTAPAQALDRVIDVAAASAMCWMPSP